MLQNSIKKMYDPFDAFIRDEKYLKKCVHYLLCIIHNEIKIPRVFKRQALNLSKRIFRDRF